MEDVDTSAETTTVTKPVPLRVSDAALVQVMSILNAEDEPDSLGLRVAVTGTRGVEYAYDLSFEERSEAADDDVVYDQGDLVVMIPADSVDALWGATLDLPSSEGQGGLVIRNPNRPNPLAGVDLDLNGTMAEKVQQLLDQSINPSLAAHGGFATLFGVDEAAGNVYLTMGGGCQGCAMSRATLTHGIKAAIVEAMPEVNDVIDATDHSAGSNPFYQ